MVLLFFFFCLLFARRRNTKTCSGSSPGSCVRFFLTSVIYLVLNCAHACAMNIFMQYTHIYILHGYHVLHIQIGARSYLKMQYSFQRQTKIITAMAASKHKIWRCFLCYTFETVELVYGFVFFSFSFGCSAQVYFFYNICSTHYTLNMYGYSSLFDIYGQLK